MSTTRTALIVVDVQNDFCEGGSLAVAGGAAIAERISSYAESARGRYDLVVASFDWHDPDSTNSGHIALPPDQPDFVDSWPPHCIAGTAGAQTHPALTVQFDAEIRKGQGIPAYSAFEGASTGEPARSLPELLRAEGITDVHVCGLALDYCVRQTALDAAEQGFATTLLADLAAPVHQERVDEVLRELRDARVAVVDAPYGAGGMS